MPSPSSWPHLAILLGALTGSTPERALRGVHGASGLKAAVADALVETLAPIQKLYRELTADPAALLALLRSGADAVGEDAAKTVANAREAIGLLSLN